MYPGIGRATKDSLHLQNITGATARTRCESAELEAQRRELPPRSHAESMVWVNAPLLHNDAGPFGGRKMPAIGRQLGGEGLDTFRHTELAMIGPGANNQDFWCFPYKDAEALPGD
jgi:hypothetical protein